MQQKGGTHEWIWTNTVNTVLFNSSASGYITKTVWNVSCKQGSFIYIYHFSESVGNMYPKGQTNTFKNAWFTAYNTLKYAFVIMAVFLFSLEQCYLIYKQNWKCSRSNSHTKNVLNLNGSSRKILNSLLNTVQCRHGFLSIMIIK